MRLILLCYIIVLKNAFVFTQQITTQYTVHNGLQSNEVYQVEKDKFGQLWMCSDRGLVSFNGSEFSYYDVTNGLRYPNVTGIYKLYNTLFFSELNGGISYLDKNNQLKKHWLGDLVKPYLGTFRYFIQAQSQGDLLYLSFRSIGIIVINVKKKKVVKVIKKNELENKLYLTEENNCFLLYNSNVPNTSHERKEYFHLVINTKKIKTTLKVKLTSDNFRFGFVQRKNKGICFQYNGQFIEIDENNKIYTTDLQNRILLSLHETDRKELVLSYWQKGVEIIAPNTLYAQNIKKSLFPTTSITSFCYDNENGAWVSTHGNGVYYISNRNIQYENIINKSVANQSFSMYRNDQHLYLCKNAESTGEIINTSFSKIIDYNLGFEYYFNIKNKEYFFRGHEAYCISNKTRINLITSNAYSNIVYKNFLLLGNFNCITLVDLNDQFHFLIPIKSNAHRVTSIQLYGKNLFIGTNCGLYWIERFTEHIKDRNKLKSLIIKPYNEVNYFNESYIKDILLQNNQLVIATIGNGVVLFNLKTKKNQRIIKKDGLFSNNIEDLSQNGNSIYTASFQGINEIKFVKDTFFVRNFASTYDLKLNDPFKVEFFKGYLYLLHSNGSGRVKVGSEANGAKKDIPCFITEILAEKIHFRGMIKKYPSTILIKKASDLSVRFTGISYRLGKATKYKYRIKGWNKAWKNTDSKLLIFPFLTSGKYELEIAAMDEFNRISNQRASFSFEIVPPFYKSVWFFILISLLVIGLILTFFFLRTRILENKMKFNLINQKATVAQINPHFIFNILNSINSDILLEDKKSASKTLVNFSNLMRQNLDNSAHALVSLENDLEALKYYLILEENRMENFTFQIQIQEEINSNTLLIPPMLIQPYVENVMRHAFVNHSKENKGEVSINIHFDGNDLKCCVTDNGIGISHSQANKKTSTLRKSMGMSITKERLEFLTNYYNNHFELTISDNLEKTSGTKVCFNLPFQRT